MKRKGQNLTIYNLRSGKTIYKHEEENKGTQIRKIGRFDDIDSPVIISSACKAIQNSKTLFTLLMMMTAESTLSKRPVLKTTVVLFFFLKLFSSHNYCIRVSRFYTFFRKLLVYTIYRVQIGAETHCQKNF